MLGKALLQDLDSSGSVVGKVSVDHNEARRSRAGRCSENLEVGRNVVVEVSADLIIMRHRGQELINTSYCSEHVEYGRLK